MKAKRKRSLLLCGNTKTSPYLTHTNTASTFGAYGSPVLHEVKLPKVGRRHPFESQLSAPATLTHSNITKHKLPPSQKFVSKYQDRSNGGIPIFSEERLKERRDKVSGYTATKYF